MKKIVFTSLVIIIATLFSCNQYDAKGNLIKSYDELDKAKWLLGEWEKKDSLGTLKEMWTTQDDSSFVGQSYYFQNKKDTLHNEQIELVQDGENLIYKATVKGENNDEAIPFQMTKSEDSVLIFENPKHDYPQKIEYKLLKNGNLMATVSGKQNNKNSTENYLMQKKK